MTRTGILFSHAYEGRVCEHPEPAAELAIVQAAQPGIEGEVMYDTGDGWRSITGESPQVVTARRWGT